MSGLGRRTKQPEQVTSAVHLNAANQALPGRTFGYEFDDIGNRLTTTTTALNGDVQTTSYTANALNQYETITRPNPLRKLIQGLANEQANIEVFRKRHGKRRWLRVWW